VFQHSHLQPHHSLQQCQHLQHQQLIHHQQVQPPAVHGQFHPAPAEHTPGLGLLAGFLALADADLEQCDSTDHASHSLLVLDLHGAPPYSVVPDWSVERAVEGCQLVAAAKLVDLRHNFDSVDSLPDLNDSRFPLVEGRV